MVKITPRYGNYRTTRVKRELDIPASLAISTAVCCQGKLDKATFLSHFLWSPSTLAIREALPVCTASSSLGY